MGVVLSKVLRKAQKHHVCNYCGCVIDKNSEYYDERFVNNDQVNTWKSHKHCNDIINNTNVFSNFLYDDGIGYDDFTEAMRIYIETEDNQPWKMNMEQVMEIVLNKLKEME